MMTSIEEIWQILKELSLAQKETDTKFKETDAKFKETDAKFKETDAKFKELSKFVSGIGEKFGSFTEGLAYASMCKVLYEVYGIDNTVANFLKRFPDGSEIELDAFGYTNGMINNEVIVEVKPKLQSKHIYTFYNQLKDFKNKFPEFKDKHLYGIIATPIVLSKELKNEVFENGIHLATVQNNIFGLERNANAIDFNAIN
jgi:hypothetical protein